MSVPSEVYLKIGARLPAPALGAKPRCAQLPTHADVVVVGAGVIGLSIAWRAALAGLTVVVVDRGEAGAGTTFSATGMLAATAEHESGGAALMPFALESQALWPAFCAELEIESGVNLDFRRSGILLVALSRDELDRLRARHTFLTNSGLDCAWISGADLRALEPGLRPSACAGIYCPNDHQVDPRALVTALLSALTLRGVTLIENCGEVGIERMNNTIEGVRLSDAFCRAPRVVMATGAWTAMSDLLPAGASVPVRPVKGQALALRARDQRQALARIVWTEQIHLAPKRDGRLIVGATMEETGFDASVTAGGVYALLEGARRALPCIEEMEIEAIWTGFRPTSDDDAPILGDVDGSGLVIATGHHRNGILLAPATADAIVELLAHGEMPPKARGLTLKRFKRED
ncbi:MAG: glycine oxidase ThiO [Beijerinckiaceae bacterium]|nr:glycine oxidase ThiO [Beijerinckiaceae bacterium]